MLKRCEFCGKSYNGKGQSKYCSKKCVGEALSKKQLIKCPQCGKEILVRNGHKFCSVECANAYKKGKSLSNILIKVCEFCGKDFETTDSAHGKLKRFCNTSCSAKWRLQTFGKPVTSELGKQKQRECMLNNWKNDSFREQNYKRMTTNNPVYMYGVVQKAKETRLKNGSYTNNFKYGNGKISKYEQIVYNDLLNLGYYYNYAIPTKLYRHAFPEIRVPDSYKPDFVNLKTKHCIEIDGKSHTTKQSKELDCKKDKCLEYLGFTVTRFTHEQIDNGEFKKWLNLYQKEQ